MEKANLIELTELTPKMHEDLHNLIKKYVSQIFLEWVESDTTYRYRGATLDDYDSSGYLEEIELCDDEKEYQKEKYVDLGDWAMGEYLGHWEPTYCSGHGRTYPTIRSEIADHILEIAREYLDTAGYMENNDGTPETVDISDDTIGWYTTTSLFGWELYDLTFWQDITTEEILAEAEEIKKNSKII